VVIASQKLLDAKSVKRMTGANQNDVTNFAAINSRRRRMKARRKISLSSLSVSTRACNASRSIR
jgi:hypothetical protein